MAHYSRGKAGWWSTVNTSLSPMQLASGCTWIWFVDSIPVLVGFLRVLRFPPTSKNRTSIQYFLVIVPVRCVVGVCKRPIARICVSAAADTQQRLETYGWLARRINTLHYYYYYSQEELCDIFDKLPRTYACLFDQFSWPSFFTNQFPRPNFTLT